MKYQLKELETDLVMESAIAYIVGNKGQRKIKTKNDETI